VRCSAIALSVKRDLHSLRHSRHRSARLVPSSTIVCGGEDVLTRREYVEGSTIIGKPGPRVCDIGRSHSNCRGDTCRAEAVCVFVIVPGSNGTMHTTSNELFPGSQVWRSTESRIFYRFHGVIQSRTGRRSQRHVNHRGINTVLSLIVYPAQAGDSGRFIRTHMNN
jgi:hypothetical protein